MSGFSAIDLSKLPVPDVIKTVDYEELLAEMKAKATEWFPDLAPFLALESEPGTKVLRVCAWFRMLDKLEFNDGARACMLPTATGTDLDNLAVFWGVERLVVQAADDTVDPPIPEELESDDALRRRTQLSLEGHTTAGSRGSYIFWSLSASGEVKDVGVYGPPDTRGIYITVLSHLGDGTPSAELLSTVNTAVNAEDVRPLSDNVITQAATIVPYNIEASLTLYEGPGEQAVLDAAVAALEAHVALHNRLGHDITRAGIAAALYRPGVQNVNIIEPAADIVIASNEVAYCVVDPSNITVGGRDV